MLRRIRKIGFSCLKNVRNETVQLLITPSSQTIALGSIQTLTEMSTSNIPEGKARPARRTDVTAIFEPAV
jgi:hypothetical protein